MMTDENGNVAKLSKAYDAWAATKGDANVWYDILAEEVSWGSLADGRPGMDFTKPRASKHDVVGYFEGLANDWSMITYIVNDYVAQGDRVVALVECGWTHRKTGKSLMTPKADVWTFKDGKVTEFMEFYDTQGALAACED